MDNYRPFGQALWIALIAIMMIVLPVAGMLVLGPYVLAAIALIFLLLVATLYALFRRRGQHAWNVDSLDITIKYEDDQGHSVSIRRDEVIYPNRRDVRAARVRLALGADPTRLTHEHWSASEELGRAFGRGAPPCAPATTFLRQAAGHWLYIHPKKGGDFPYPGLLALFRPRHHPHGYYRIKVRGSTTYRNCFTADDEYYELRLDDTPDIWVRAVSFTLVLPDEWDDDPAVCLYRSSATHLDRIDVDGEPDDDNPGCKRFTAKTEDCSHESLRLDWRRRPAT